MVEYAYKKIESIDSDGIVFTDGNRIPFEKCINNWAEENGMKCTGSRCIAERNSTANPAYFLFFSTEKVKVTFRHSILPWSKRHKKAFLKLQKEINQYGYSSYDIS